MGRVAVLVDYAVFRGVGAQQLALYGLASRQQPGVLAVVVPRARPPVVVPVVQAFSRAVGQVGRQAVPQGRPPDHGGAGLYVYFHDIVRFDTVVRIMDQFGRKPVAAPDHADGPAVEPGEVGQVVPDLHLEEGDGAVGDGVTVIGCVGVPRKEAAAGPEFSNRVIFHGRPYVHVGSADLDVHPHDVHDQPQDLPVIDQSEKLFVVRQGVANLVWRGGRRAVGLAVFAVELVDDA